MWLFLAAASALNSCLKRNEGLTGWRGRSLGLGGRSWHRAPVPGLPAASIIPDAAEGGQPGSAGAGSVVKVGPHSVWGELLQFLFFLYSVSTWFYSSRKISRTHCHSWICLLTFFKKFFIGRSYLLSPSAVLLILNHPGRCGTWNWKTSAAEIKAL